MREVSLVGKRGEEAGENFTEYNSIMENRIPLLKYVLPWGIMSDVKGLNRCEKRCEVYLLFNSFVPNDRKAINI